jgi:hypothetical protein
MKTAKPSYINRDTLPALYPTHAHPGPFWEQLGRTVGTFGFLEEVLGKAIFAFTAIQNYSEDEIENAYKAWLPKLEKALSDQLCRLAKSYGAAVKESQHSTVENIDELVQAIKDAAKVRNILCHASWRVPNEEGKSLPFFVNFKNGVCETKFDIASLRQIQHHVRELACAVIDSVAQAGYAFPGGTGPGERIWHSSCLNDPNSQTESTRQTQSPLSSMSMKSD